MASGSTRPLGLVCDDRPAVRRMASGILTACGFDVCEERGALPPPWALSVDVGVSLLVLGLPSPGVPHLAAVHRLCSAVPGTCVVLLCSFTELAGDARSAGARAMVAETDAEGLCAVVTSVATECLHGELQLALPRQSPGAVEPGRETSVRPAGR